MSTQLVLVSDFNVEPLARLLRTSLTARGVTVRVADYGQVVQTLGSPLFSPSDTVVVWTRPEGILPSLSRALLNERVSEAEVMADVDQFADAVIETAKRCGSVLVANWMLPPGYRGLGPLDARLGVGASGFLLSARMRLAERLRDASNVGYLSPESWVFAAGPAASAPRMWYAAKVPYAASVFTAAAEDIVSALAATSGLARKVIVLDLDNTLWGGVVGEVGWRHVHLGGHHHLGEAFVDFQRVLKGMSRRGIQLVIASKNDESVALEAIDRHPDMILRRDDFATWRIDWRDKATNIQSMAQELNLGTSSFVFIDDNPSERGRVREQLPEVLVPDWPVDPTRYVQAFRALRCFDTIALSDEDLARSSMYAAERARRREAEMFADGGDWLASLGVTVHANRLTSDDLSRAAQLLNKTNQLNLATRRLSEVELMDWATQPGQEVWTFRVDDRFGPSGLTGLLGLRHEANETTIVDFLLSCRVMGRKVEEAMLHVAWRRANANGSTALRAQYFETERNGPCLQCFRASGLSETEPHLFSWDVSRSYAQPKTVTIQGLSDHVDDA